MTTILADPELENEFFSSEELMRIKKGKVPHHVAIIMDGNRRWAKKYGLSQAAGHRRGAEILTRIVRAAAKLGVKVLTVYAFSTENWNRSRLEIETLMQLLKFYLLKQQPQMVREGVKLDTIGDLNRLPDQIKKILHDVKLATKDGESIELVIALNYGGRNEILRATKAILKDGIEGKIRPEDLSEVVFSKYLDTFRWKDPDLLIRTSGEKRISNFLLWQISYAEIFITDLYWPDFDEEEFLRAIIEYQNREIRFGK
ncbi:MAG: polyprenyl diphosphate synthase [Chlamydiae bacterium]|nr:polyprenyl diphosphate synthase [Chlamydiota bacterium]